MQSVNVMESDLQSNSARWEVSRYLVHLTFVCCGDATVRVVAVTAAAAARVADTSKPLSHITETSQSCLLAFLM